MRRRKKLDREEQKLHDIEDDGFMVHGDPFTTGVGHFWGLLHTRDYMRARHSFVDCVLKVNTLDAVETAVEHCMDMLHLCRSDNMGIRDLVPALLLRLGKDQECYDFVKWWETCDPDGEYDWGDTSLPYLDVKNADLLEPVEYLCGSFPELSRIVAVTLLKIRLLLGMERALESSATLRESQALPSEMFDQIQESLLSSTLGKRLEGMTSTRCSQLINTLHSQVETLCTAVEGANEHFWPALLDPDDDMEACPEVFATGSIEEMEIVWQYSMNAWKETPGALEMIRTKLQDR